MQNIFLISLISSLVLGGMIAVNTFFAEGSLIAGIINVLLFVLLFALILSACVYFVLLPYVLILMEISIWQSILTAFNMVRGYFWRTLWLLILLAFITSAFLAITNIVLGIMALVFDFILPGSQLVFTVLGFVPSALALLIFHVPLIAWYIDLSLKLWTPENQVFQ